MMLARPQLKRRRTQLAGGGVHIFYTLLWAMSIMRGTGRAADRCSSAKDSAAHGPGPLPRKV